jgi:hypothetical protein
MDHKGNSNERMLSEHLVKIILAGNLVTQSWLKFLVTIQGGLAVGFVFVLRPSEQMPPWLILPMCFLIPFVAALSAFAVSAFIIRHQQWQGWYVRAYNSIPGNAHNVFPYDGQLPPKTIEEMPDGYVSNWVRRLRLLLILVWLVAAVAAAVHAAIELMGEVVLAPMDAAELAPQVWFHRPL